MRLTLNKLFNFTDNDGIFTYLNSYNVPWKNDIDVDILDLDYHTKHGTKIIGKPIQVFLTEDGLSTQNKQKLAKLIYNKNKVKWDELYSSMSLYDEFNPLDNTNWTEEERIEHRGTDGRTINIGSKTNSFTKGSQTNGQTIGQQLVTDGQQTNTIGAESNSVENKVSASNVTTYSNKDTTTETRAARNDVIGSKETRTSSREDSFTEGQRQDSSTEGAQQNSESGTNSYTDIHTISRHGNIGVTTSGQMIEDFRKVVNWQFFDIVYKDINDVLVLDVYGDDNEDLDDYTFIQNYVLPIASATILGGIKVGNNLSIDANGVLSAQAEAGDVQSVNGKTGVVVLGPTDIGSPSNSDFNALALVVNGHTTDIGALTTALAAVRQVPTGGTTGQILKKLAEGYGWADESAGGAKTKVFNPLHITTNPPNTGCAVRMDEDTLLAMVLNYSNMVINGPQPLQNVEWKKSIPGKVLTNASLAWDGKILLVKPIASNSVTFNNYSDVFIESTNPNYVNNVKYHAFEYKDSANATFEWTLDSPELVNHIAIAITQYSNYSQNPLQIIYYDEENLEYDISSLVTANVHEVWGTDAVISYDLNDTVSKFKIISPSGYRVRMVMGYY